MNVTCLFFRYFTIVGSKLVRHKEKYHVSVTAQGYDEPQTLEVAIRNSNKENDESKFEVSQNVTLINDKLQQIEFDVSSKIKLFSCL